MVNIKIDFKDYQKDRNFILIKGSIHHEHITVPNEHPSKRVSKIHDANIDRTKGRNR